MKKKSKYRNQPVVIGGIRFDSKREGRRYGELMILQAAGVISGLKLQPRYPIKIGGVEVRAVSISGATGRIIVYVGDFEYLDRETGKTVIEDVKGMRTDVYKLKRSLMAAMGLTITEVR